MPVDTVLIHLACIGVAPSQLVTLQNIYPYYQVLGLPHLVLLTPMEGVGGKEDIPVN